MTTWSEALSGIPIEQVRTALVKLPIVYPTWPPTLGEFLKLCKIEQVPPAHRPLLPSPRGGPVDPRVLVGIRAMMIRAKKRDPKAWAREILEEAERGEYRCVAGILAAREALKT